MNSPYAVITYSDVVQSITPFTYTLSDSFGAPLGWQNCGDQVLTIPEHATLTPPYIQVLSVTAYDPIADDFTLTLSGALATHEAVYSPTIQVNFVDPAWSFVTLTTAIFTAECVHPCRDVTLLTLSSFADLTTSVLFDIPLEQDPGPVMYHSPYSTTSCGPLLYTLVYTETSYVNAFLTLDPSTGKITVDANQHSLVGTYIMAWDISYANYVEAIHYVGDPIIGGPGVFNIEILPCEIVSIVPPSDLILPSQYTIGTAFEILEFDAFSQVPACAYDMEYFLTENVIDIIDPNLDFYCKYSPTNKDYVSIETAIPGMAGTHTIYVNARTTADPVIQNMDTYQFEIEIIAPPDLGFTHNFRPYFVEQIQPQYMSAGGFSVSQGFDETSNSFEDFAYQLPMVADRNDDAITISTFLGPLSAFLEFDESTMMLKLIQGSTPVPGNYTIYFTLQDDNPIGSATSQVKVDFEVCEEVPAVVQYNRPTEGGLIPRIVSISSKGDVILKWSGGIMKQHNITEYEEDLRKLVKTRDIKTGMTVRKPAFEIYNAYSNEDAVQDDLDHTFEWELIEFVNNSTNEWKIKLYFKQPIIISMKIPADFLEIKFWHQDLFQAVNGRYVEEQLLLRKQIPPQLELNELTEAMEDAAFVGKVVMISAGVIAAASSLIWSVLAGHLVWNMLNELQLMAHLPIFSVTFPANAFIFYDQIISVAMLDLYETGDIIQEWFKVDNEVSHSPELLRLDYQYMNFLSNIGCNLVIWAAVPVIILISLPLKLFSRCSSVCRKVYGKFCDKMYYSFLIRLLMQSVLEFCICGLVDLQAMNISNLGYSLSYILSALAITAIITYAFWIRLFLGKNIDNLADPEFMKKYGQAYTGFKEPQEEIGMLALEVFIFRRLSYSLIAIFLINQKYAQLQLLFMTTIATIAVYQITQPYISKSTHNTEILNDFFILIILYHIVLFSNLIIDTELKWYIGYSCIIFTCIMIIANIFELLLRIIVGIKQKYAMLKARKESIMRKFKSNLKYEVFHQNRLEMRQETAIARAIANKRNKQAGEAQYVSRQEIEQESFSEDILRGVPLHLKLNQKSPQPVNQIFLDGSPSEAKAELHGPALYLQSRNIQDEEAAQANSLSLKPSQQSTPRSLRDSTKNFFKGKQTQQTIFNSLMIKNLSAIELLGHTKLNQNHGQDDKQQRPNANERRQTNLNLLEAISDMNKLNILTQDAPSIDRKTQWARRPDNPGVQANLEFIPERPSQQFRDRDHSNTVSPDLNDLNKKLAFFRQINPLSKKLKMPKSRNTDSTNTGKKQTESNETHTPVSHYKKQNTVHVRHLQGYGQHNQLPNNIQPRRSIMQLNPTQKLGFDQLTLMKPDTEF